MAKSKREQQEDQEKQQSAQQYDTTFKDWLRQVARYVLPLFLPGVIYEGVLDAEIIRPTMRVDKVFKVIYRGKACILHLEFESGTDPHILSRLLTYNAVLYHDHHMPVISMIVYPFKTTLAMSPLRVSDGNEEILTFHFQTLPLFTENAERYIREHIVSMYPVLPVMRGINHVLMQQVMDELAELYRGDEVSLSQQFVWMQLLLERTGTISPQEKVKIKEALKMYDSLWNDHPRVQKILAEGKAQGLEQGLEQGLAQGLEKGLEKGLAQGLEQGLEQGLAQGLKQGLVKGELQASRRMLVNVVKVRFPALAELAQQRTAQIDKPDALELLVQQISTAPDEQTAHWLLNASTA